MEEFLVALTKNELQSGNILFKLGFLVEASFHQKGNLILQHVVSRKVEGHDQSLNEGTLDNEVERWENFCLPLIFLHLFQCFLDVGANLVYIVWDQGHELLNEFLFFCELGTVPLLLF